MKFKNNRLQIEWNIYTPNDKYNIDLCNVAQGLAEAVEKKLEKNSKENIYLLIKKLRMKFFEGLSGYSASWVTSVLLYYWKYGSQLQLVKESDNLEEILVMRSMFMTNCDNDEGIPTLTNHELLEQTRSEGEIT